MSDITTVKDQVYGLDPLEIDQRIKELGQALADPYLGSRERPAIQKEHMKLTALLQHLDAFLLTRQALRLLEQEKESVAQDLELMAVLEQEIEQARRNYQEADEAVQFILFPPDEEDQRSVFLEIRAGTGGQEAALFAGDLARMYTLHAQLQGWRASIASSSTTDLGGYREIIVHIEGRGVYGRLKRESGVHRVQRVPATETQGRIHTSTATVAVLAEEEEVPEATVSMADLRIDVYRASGAGGQHVNTTDSAVRITHLPSGLVVACQDERSQYKNKTKALKILQSRLKAMQKEQQQKQDSAVRKEQIGTGQRSEKVRTYNFPQNRVTDHQIGMTLNKLDRVMEGDLADLIQALVQDEAIKRQQAGISALIKK